MLKCLNLNANILTKHSDIHNYYTRNKNKFIAPKCNMKKSDMFINFKSIKVCNRLTADIRISDSLNVFMDNLNNHYLLMSSSLMYFLFSAICCISVQRVNNNRTIFHKCSCKCQDALEARIAYNWAHVCSVSVRMPSKPVQLTILMHKLLEIELVCIL